MSRQLAARVAVVDAGPLYAAVDVSDRDHARCVALLQRPEIRLVVPAFCANEATYLVGRRFGPDIESRFLDSLADLDVRAPEPEDWRRISALVKRYRDLPLGGADASLAVLAERLGTNLIITLDRRHFGVLRNPAGNPYELLP